MLVGERLLSHAYCAAYTYVGKQLSQFVFDNPTLLTSPMGSYSASEINIHFGAGYPFPILEISAYSSQRNGRHFICKLSGTEVTIICSVELEGWHFSTWEDCRDYFTGTSLQTDDRFACNFDNFRQDIRFEDIDGDGYIDIVLDGEYQCKTISGDIILSETARDVVLYNGTDDRYEYSKSFSVLSPLRSFWGGHEFVSHEA